MNRPLTRLGAAVAAAALLLSGCEFEGAYDLPLPGSPVDEEHAFTVTADFDDVLNVVPRSVVMVDDVTVGEVIEVDRVGWHARITMRIKDGTRLPDNAIADIRQTSLLGEKYVALEDPVGQAPTGQLGEGDKIELAATGRNPEVEEVLGALSFLLSGGGVGQLGTITDELNKVMDGRTDRLRHLLGSLESVIGTIDSQREEIISALESMNGLAKTLNAERDTIGEALDAMSPAVEVLSAQHDELMQMLDSLDRLGIVGARVIGASKDDLLRTLADLRPVLSRLHEAGDKLVPGLNLAVSFPFPKEAAEVVKGDYANASIRAAINLRTVLPPGTPNPIPPIEIPDPGQVVGGVLKCLDSGRLTSRACQRVVADLDLLDKLRKNCRKKANRDNPVCRALNALPAAGDGNGPGLPSLPGIPGLVGFSGALSSGAPTPAYTSAAMYGGSHGALS